MVQYRDLNAPPSRMLADVVADMKAQERQSKTGDAGVKDLGESGDVVWPRPDGTPVSVRDVDLDLADARQRIEDAEGDLAGAQARIDTALDAEGHVREDEILRNATLLGETVVQEINVTEKLVGTDGVFTGTVDFANVNVTGELLANEISGEHVYGTVVEGGEIRTTDGLPAQVTLSDTAFAPPFDGGGTPRPGIRIDSGTVTPVHKPGVGPVSGGGIAVYSGQNSSGQWGALTVRGSRTEILNDGGDGRTSRIEVSTGAIDVRMESPTGSSGARVTTNSSRLFAASSTIIADQYEARLSTSAGGTTRSLSIDGTGVWVTTNRSGVTESWNLEETASDSGWKTFPMNSALTGAGSPAYRIKSGTVFLRGSVTLPGASWSGGWTTIGVLPAAATPTFDVQRPTITSAMSQVPETYLQVNTSGQFQVWIPRSVAGTTVIQLSPMSYVAG